MRLRGREGEIKREKTRKIKKERKRKVMKEIEGHGERKREIKTEEKINKDDKDVEESVLLIKKVNSILFKKTKQQNLLKN